MEIFINYITNFFLFLLKVPETIAGKIVASACSVCGLVFVAVFVSVIVANYNRNYLQKCFEKKDPMKIKSSYHSV